MSDHTAIMGAVLDLQHQLANGHDPDTEIVGDLVRAVPALLDEVERLRATEPQGASMSDIEGVIAGAVRMATDPPAASGEASCMCRDGASACGVCLAAGPRGG